MKYITIFFLMISATANAAIYYFDTEFLDVSTVIFTNVFVTNLVSGDNDIYTVPANKKLIVALAEISAVTNNVDEYMEVKTNGVYYPVSGSSSLNIEGAGGATTALFIYEESEVVAVNLTNSALSVNLSAILLPNTFPAKTLRTYSLSSGDNTIYTCPASTMAVSWSRTISRTALSDLISSTYVNFSGSSRKLRTKLILSGVDPSLVAYGGYPPSVSDKSIRTIGSVSVMNAGDSLIVNVDANTATQAVYTTLIERSVP